MRDPYIELGIGIIGQAIRDWRLESKACAWKKENNSQELHKIKKFLNGELAQLCLISLDMDAKELLKRLQAENSEKREQHERGYTDENY